MKSDFTDNERKRLANMGKLLSEALDEAVTVSVGPMGTTHFDVDWLNELIDQLIASIKLIEKEAKTEFVTIDYTRFPR
jgi:hypothetical protein